MQVSSKNPTEDVQHTWESSAANSFTVVADPENTLVRGTRVTLFLKEDAQEFLEEKKLSEMIKKYSEFINFPIKLRTFREEEREVVDEDAAATPEEPKEEVLDEEDEVKEENEEKEEEKPKMKKIKEKVPDWKHVNDNKAIWTRAKEEIEDKEYV